MRRHLYPDRGLVILTWCSSYIEENSVSSGTFLLVFASTGLDGVEADLGQILLVHGHIGFRA